MGFQNVQCLLSFPLPHVIRMTIHSWYAMLLLQVERELQAQYKTGAFTAMAAMDALPAIPMDMGLYARGSHAAVVQILLHNPGNPILSVGNVLKNFCE